MIINFNEFLNEYRGPFSPIGGFKPNQDTPTLKFKLNVVLMYKPDNEEKIKNIISQYDIPVDEFNVGRDVDAETPFGIIKLQQLDLTFLSHNNYEASSIIDSIQTELNKNNKS